MRTKAVVAFVLKKTQLLQFNYNEPKQNARVKLPPKIIWEITIYVLVSVSADRR